MQATVGIFWLVLLSLGCRRDEEIRHYRIPKEEVAPTPKAARSIRYTVPEQWAPGQEVVSRGGFTIRHEAAFEVVDGDQRVDVTVDRMPGGGSLLQNVPRWSAQVGLEPAPPSEVEGAIEKIEIGGVPAEYIELTGETESVFAAVVSAGAEFWYIKLKGANELAANERERFKAFLGSIQFE
jgi:hypothetical protein